MNKKLLTLLGCVMVTALSLGDEKVNNQDDLELRISNLEKRLEKTEEIPERINKMEKEMDLWEVHGYASLQYRISDKGSSTDTTFGKGDFFLGIPGTGESANQVELVVKRKFYGKNGVFGDLNLRVEYGNGDSYMYSSSGSEHDNGKANFEVKEAFINMGGFDFLPENSTIWAGRRFLNREATFLSGEFYKQSSGVGFGYEKDGYTIAVMGVDPGAENGKANSKTFRGLGRRTINTVNIGKSGVEVPGGKIDLEGKYYYQSKAKEADSTWDGKDKNPNRDNAKSGFGLGVSYHTSYYGLDGFANHYIGYGKDLGAHTTGGMNFGQWTDGAKEGASSLFATTGGLFNLNDKWQIGTELSILHGDKIYGLNQKLTRAGFSLQPSYKVNENFRMVFGATIGMQEFSDAPTWGKDDKRELRYGFSIAPTFTVDADFFGRPQIQPFATWMKTNQSAGFGGDLGDKKSQVIFGVKSEVWF